MKVISGKRNKNIINKFRPYIPVIIIGVVVALSVAILWQKLPFLKILTLGLDLTRATTVGDPQYIVISPQTNEEFLQPGVLQDMINKLGIGTATRKLGWMVRIQGFQETDTTILYTKLQKSFALAEQYDLPLAFHIDTEFWWENRPDLWNWWDPTKAGYNPDNKFNVEWSSWDTPTKERWINWGSPLAIKPQPCFGSPRVRQELATRAAVIGPKIEAWRQRLAGLGKSYLFIGINPTGETGLEDLRIFGAEIGIPPQGRIQSGFCSLYQRGYRKKSPPTDMARALALEVQDYANAEVLAYKAQGIPATYLSTHAPTGVYGKQYANAPAWTAVNANSIPGFSVYGVNELADIKAGIGDRDWVISESNPSVLPTYINDPRLRWIAEYNWGAGMGGIADDPNAQAVIRIALESSPPSTTNNASFVSQNVPIRVSAGQSFSVSITMKNTGNTTWNGQYLLGDQSGGPGWGSIRIPLSVASVTPGNTYVFSGTLIAPSAPGSYNFQWQMLQEGIQWFGAKTPNQVVTVTNGTTSPTPTPIPTQTPILTPTPIPPPSSSLSCSPSSQTVTVGQLAVLNGTSAAAGYYWYTYGGNPSSGKASTFITQYSTSGTKSILLQSGVSSVYCTVYVVK